MNVVVLTTQTTHHAYFVRELQQNFPISGVLLEEKQVKPPFATGHAFENKRDFYERKVFFGGRDVRIDNLVGCTCTVESVNDRRAIDWFKKMRPDVAIVFGTSLIKPRTMRSCGIVLNLHGGDPRAYRGLDSHLWAIYHKDFSGLAVTLHKVNAVLDGGDIVSCRRLKVAAGMKIHELRRSTTEICVRLVTQALREIDKKGAIRSMRQKIKGRYYSFMPSCLKDVCQERFESYARSLR